MGKKKVNLRVKYPKFLGRGDSYLILLLLTSSIFSESGHAASQGFSSTISGTVSGTVSRVASDSTNDETPFFLQASDITYDPKNHLMIAQGNVYLAHGNHLLGANRILYDTLKESARAEGRVWLKEKSGEEIFAHSIELKKANQEMLIKDLRMRLADNARFAANKATLKEVMDSPTPQSTEASGSTPPESHQELTLHEAVYSPCKLCTVDPNETPFWQLKADQIVHDKKSQTLYYYNARLEFKGTQVMAVPYFQHPDPLVKRKSGFLVPKFGFSKDLGLLLKIPIYYVIAPNRDLTIAPTFMTRQGILLSGEYRHRFHDGDLKLSLSSLRPTSPPKPTLADPNPAPKNRWHFFLDSRFDLTDRHLLKVKIERASDMTYLRRFPVFNSAFQAAQQKNLTSSISLEQFEKKHYGAIKLYSFETDTPKTTPFVLPQARWMFQSTPGKWKEQWDFEVNVLSLKRRQSPALTATEAVGRGESFQRLSSKGGFRLPYVTKNGHEFILRTFLRADAYYVHHSERTPATVPPTFRTLRMGRLLPQGAIEWRYPLMKRFSAENSLFQSWYLEPKVSFFASPSLLNNKIPNEAPLEFDDTNLFLVNRFCGYDNLDSGRRIVYGAKNTLVFKSKPQVSLFLGQSLRLDNSQIFPRPALGENKRASDWIIKAEIRYLNWIQAQYRAAFNHTTYRPRFSEFSLKVGQPIFNVSTAHLYMDESFSPTGATLSQLNWKAASQLNENWSVSFTESRNLKSTAGQSNVLLHILNVNFQNDCFQATVGVYKTAYHDKDIRPDTGVLFQLVFKNLGVLSPITNPDLSNFATLS